MWFPQQNFNSSKCGDWQKGKPKWNMTFSKWLNWSSCRKLVLSASWTHGLLGQTVRASEQNSVVVGWNATQNNFLYILQWWIFLESPAHSTTLMWLTEQNFDLNVETGEGINRNEIWHWTNDGIGVGLQSCIWVWIKSWYDRSFGKSIWMKFNGCVSKILLNSIFYIFFTKFFNGYYHLYPQLIPLHLYDFPNKISTQIIVTTDKGINQNKIWHLTNDEIGVAAQSWNWVRVELMVSKLNRLERLNGIQWLSVEIPLSLTFYSYFK